MSDCDERKSIFENEEQKQKYIEPLQKTNIGLRASSTEKNEERIDGEYQRDYCRIMYASSFRRLQGKMQLLGIEPDEFFRNRLTHSLEVAQIARSIACKAGYKQEEIYVVEAGALAHDMGNPPFGHSGERKLHDLFKTVGGFEGNAQTLRILTSVERKRPEMRGLNLTYRTMLSVVKYFHRYREGNAVVHSKFIYDDDYKMLSDFVGENDIKVRTLDVQIVDIADEIAYAVHDLEDGLRQNCFTIDEILHEFYRKYGNSAIYEHLEMLVKTCKEKSGYMSSKLDSSICSKLFRQELSSKITNCLINDLKIKKISNEERIKRGTQYEEELGFDQYGEIAHGLKSVTFNCINHNDNVYTYEDKGNKILETLVEFYRKEPKYLPPEYRVQNYIKKAKEDEKIIQDRLICDYVSGMMDSYAINCYEKLTGESFEKIII